LRAIQRENWDANGAADFAMGAPVYVRLNGVVWLAFLRDQGWGLVDDFDGGVAVALPDKIQPDNLVELVKAD